MSFWFQRLPRARRAVVDKSDLSDIWDEDSDKNIDEDEDKDKDEGEGEDEDENIDEDEDIGNDLLIKWHSWLFLTDWEDLIMTVRVSDWQSESDLTAFAILGVFLWNSCLHCYTSWYGERLNMVQIIQKATISKHLHQFRDSICSAPSTFTARRDVKYLPTCLH